MNPANRPSFQEISMYLLEYMGDITNEKSSNTPKANDDSGESGERLLDRQSDEMLISKAVRKSDSFAFADFHDFKEELANGNLSAAALDKAISFVENLQEEEDSASGSSNECYPTSPKVHNRTNSCDQKSKTETDVTEPKVTPIPKHTVKKIRARTIHLQNKPLPLPSEIAPQHKSPDIRRPTDIGTGMIKMIPAMKRKTSDVGLKILFQILNAERNYGTKLGIFEKQFRKNSSLTSLLEPGDSTILFQHFESLYTLHKDFLAGLESLQLSDHAREITNLFDKFGGLFSTYLSFGTNLIERLDLLRNIRKNRADVASKLDSLQLIVGSSFETYLAFPSSYFVRIFVPAVLKLIKELAPSDKLEAIRLQLEEIKQKLQETTSQYRSARMKELVSSFEETHKPVPLKDRWVVVREGVLQAVTLQDESIIELPTFVLTPGCLLVAESKGDKLRLVMQLLFNANILTEADEQSAVDFSVTYSKDETSFMLGVTARSIHEKRVWMQEIAKFATKKAK
eukprot:TRINITY_DN982_c0_g4_i1.p1 TRINITY_DN982_c0_g4~~TRINITY_DN982_c0_g4_i1.p1  ORF type:complete len:512 (+),score=65.12 TRINITY_DN982_c0_g4_i1:304-1839(+)